jgi:hypothetical protein
LEVFGLEKLVAKWKSGFINIKETHMFWFPTFYLEIIEGEMTEKTKDKVNDFLNVLESKFPDLFIVFEEKVILLF